MQLPLFPLKTVLFPGGVAPLRVFEARYMDMVRACMKHDAPFGIVLISKGAEVGAPAATESIGTLATIADWAMPQLGVLQLRAVGGERFRIERSQLRADGLQVGEVEPIGPDPDFPLAERFRPCAAVLERVIGNLEDRRGPGADEASINAIPFEPPYRLDSSVWVGNRLCEVMPVPLAARQKLMALRDAVARLELVQRFLKEHAVLK